MTSLDKNEMLDGTRPVSTTIARGERLSNLIGLLLALYVFTLPLEVTSAVFPILRTARVGPDSVSLVNATRLVLVVLIVFLPIALEASRGRWSRWELLVGSAFLGLYIVGALYSADRSTAATETVRLVTNLYVMLLIVIAVRKQWVARWLIGALRASMIMSAITILVSGLTGVAIWRSSGASGPVRFAAINAGDRPSGTFFDPNIAGRYLVVTLIFCLLLPVAVSRPSAGWARTQILRATEVILFTAAILATGSRSAIVALVLALLVAVFLLPRNHKGYALLALGTGGLAFPALAAAVPSLGSRISTLQSGTAALGSRNQLIRAGIEMFLDHPLQGVGTSGFAPSIRGPYARYQSYYGSAQTASHTSVVTLLAEHGVLGLVAIGIAAAAVIASYRTLRRQSWRTDGALAAATLLSLLVIFLSSLAEGRLIEESLAWVLFGLLIGRARSSDPSGPRGAAFSARPLWALQSNATPLAEVDEAFSPFKLSRSRPESSRRLTG